MLSCHTSFFIWHVLHVLGSVSDQFYQISIANRLWPIINSVQLQNVLHVIVPTLLNRKLEKYFAPVRIWDHKINLLKYLCVKEFSSSPCHDEVIILSLPCDLSARRTWLVAFLSPDMYIKENSRNGCCSTSLFSK